MYFILSFFILIVFANVLLAAPIANSAEANALENFLQLAGCDNGQCALNGFTASSDCPTTTDTADPLHCVGGKVTRLRLVEADLDGSLTSHIGMLTGLTYLTIRTDDQLGGTVPTHLALLTDLEVIFMYSLPGIVGQWPDMNALTKLSGLYVYANPGLSGTFMELPSSLQGLTLSNTKKTGVSVIKKKIFGFFLKITIMFFSNKNSQLNLYHHL